MNPSEIPDQPNTGHLPSPARSFLAEAHDAGMPLSEKEAVFLSSIKNPDDGHKRIPKELLERLQKHGVANCTHHPDW